MGSKNGNDIVNFSVRGPKAILKENAPMLVCRTRQENTWLEFLNDECGLGVENGNVRVNTTHYNSTKNCGWVTTDLNEPIKHFVGKYQRKRKRHAVQVNFTSPFNHGMANGNGDAAASATTHNYQGPVTRSRSSPLDNSNSTSNIQRQSKRKRASVQANNATANDSSEPRNSERSGQPSVSHWYGPEDTAELPVFEQISLDEGDEESVVNSIAMDEIEDMRERGVRIELMKPRVIKSIKRKIPNTKLLAAREEKENLETKHRNLWQRIAYYAPNLWQMVNIMLGKAEE